MKKLLLISILIPSLSFASVKGIGEYFYGPDTSDNLACSFAEEKAKEDAILNFSGQTIDINTNETCSSEDIECSFLRETNLNTSGVINRVKNKQVKKYVEEGQKICLVEIEVDIQKVQKRTMLFLKDFNHVFRVDDEVKFFVIVNKPGKLIIFNFFDNKYHKLYEMKVDSVNVEFQVPQKQKMIVTLENGVLTNKEKLTFVYSELDLSTKKVYNEFEMNTFLKSIPIDKKDVRNRFVQIVR